MVVLFTHSQDNLPELVLELRFSSVLPMTAYPGGCRLKILTPSTSNQLILQVRYDMTLVYLA